MQKHHDWKYSRESFHREPDPPRQRWISSSDDPDSPSQET